MQLWRSWLAELIKKEFQLRVVKVVWYNSDIDKRRQSELTRRSQTSTDKKQSKCCRESSTSWHDNCFISFVVRVFSSLAPGLSGCNSCRISPHLKLPSCMRNPWASITVESMNKHAFLSLFLMVHSPGIIMNSWNRFKHFFYFSWNFLVHVDDQFYALKIKGAVDRLAAVVLRSLNFIHSWWKMLLPAVNAFIRWPENLW